jgi:predicted AlkP superfamily phosphohydrolase/phosphomutase
VTKRVLMIGLDGATFTLLKPLSRMGALPFLTGLIGNGVSAHLMSTRNPLTPPAWTSMTTGVTPERHGIYDFLRPAYLKDGSVYLKVNDRRQNRAETVFAMVGRHGLRSTALNFYGYSPAPEIDGYVVSGFVPWKHLRHGIHPRDLFDRLKASTEFDYRDLGMDIGEEKKVVQGLDADEHEEWIELQNVRDRAWTDVTCRLMAEDRTELTAVVLDGPDKMQHLFWRYLDPEADAGEPGERTERIRALCVDFYRRMDDNIRRMVEAAGPDTNVLIVSDHGFGPTTEIFYVNQWLAEHGYLAWSEAATSDAKGQLTSDKIRDHLGMIDWRKTKAFCATPSSNGIYIKPESASGISADDYMDFALKLRRELLEWTDPDTGTPVVVGAEMNKMRGVSYVEPCPDITLHLRDGGFVSILNSDRCVVQRKLADGTHRPEGVFVGYGPDFRRDEVLDPLNLLDITPLMLTLIGVPVPSDLDGRVPVEALEPGVAPTSGGESRRSSGTAAETGTDGEVSEEERQTLLRQMQKLGYMD